jgi:hypothetical protein
MSTLSRLWTVAGAAVCLLITNGCISANRGNHVSKIVSFPVADRKPSIYIERYENKSFINDKSASWQMLENLTRDITLQRFSKSGLFDRVDSVNFGAEYTIHIEDRTDTFFNEAGRGFHVITLGLVPSIEHRTHKLTAHVRNNRTGVVTPVEVKETLDVWIDILLLPVAIFRPASGDTMSIFSDLVDNLAIAVRNTILKNEQSTVSASVVKPAVVESPSVVVQPPPVVVGDDTLVNKLKLLKSAREANLLTEQEYQQKRADLLKGL